MKTYFLLAFSILFFALVSCKKETKIATSGTVTLSSQQIPYGQSYAINGLSFLAGDIHKYPAQEVDIIVLALKPSGDITAVFFTAPDYYTGNFNNTFFNQDLAAAESQFDNYSEVTASNFQPLTDTLKVGQIITYKNSANQYAKILVSSINIVKIDPPYAEVTIKWAFQPNGTTKF